MFEKFMSVNARDFSQRYQGTYGFFKREDKKTLVRLVNVNVDRGQVEFIDAKSIPYQLNQNSTEDVGFEFLPPKSSWHNTSMGALLVRRIPQRQYSRGICDANTSIQQIGMRAVPVEFKTLSAIFERSLTPQQAEKTGRSFAVSEQFAVWPEEKRLYLFHQHIGSAVKQADGSYDVSLNDSEMFKVETFDAFTRAGFKVQIK